MPGRLEGKVCVVTGAASGIGAETARLFASEGAHVVGVDLAEGAEGELALQADVADDDSVREMYEKAACETTTRPPRGSRRQRGSWPRLTFFSTSQLSHRTTTSWCSTPLSRPGSAY